MNDKRIARLKRNTISSLTFELVTIICGFILPKYILTYYGSEINGLVSSITQFLGFISLCELGMGAVVPASLYKPLAENNLDQISRIIKATQKFYRIIASILIGYIVLLIFIYPTIINTSLDKSYSVSLIIIISLSTFAQYFFGVSYTLLLNSDQKQYISLVINTFTVILNTVLCIVLVKLGYDIRFVKLISSLVFIIRPLALNIYVKRNYNLDLKIEDVGEPIKQKWNGVAQHFATTIQEKADVVILTVLSSLTNVSVYGVYFMVVNGIKGLVYSLTAGMSSLIGNMLAKNETLALKETFTKFEWLMHTLSVFLFTLTSIVVVPFVKVYTNSLPDKNIYIAPMFAVILCAALAARCIQMPYNVVVQAAGHFKETQKSAIIEPIINIVISVLFVYNFGLVGVAIGTLVSMSYRVIYLAVYLMKNILYTNGVSFIKLLVIDVLTVVLMAVSSNLFTMKDISYTSWVVFSLKEGIVCLMISVLVNLCCYRGYIFDVGRSLVNKKK